MHIRVQKSKYSKCYTHRQMHLTNVKLQTISYERGTTGALILNKNSPFTKMINKGKMLLGSFSAIVT